MILKKGQWMHLLIILVVIAAAGCDAQPSGRQKISKDFFYMDTLINITVYSSDQVKGQEAVEKAAGEFQRINNLVGRFSGKNLPDPQSSDVYRVNEKAGIEPVQVSNDTLAMVERAKYFTELSGGAFNFAIGPVMDLWCFGGEKCRVPTAAELKKTLALTNYREVVIDKIAKTIFLPKKGMIMDLGGVAKGYATDLAVKSLRSAGIKSALVNAGGNVFTVGSKPDGSPWKIGIQDPRDENNVVAIVSVTDSAVVSSGDYERYFEKNGVRYHHIIDPANGNPARGLIGTTIIMDNSTDADILSTSMFVLGAEKGMALQKKLPGVEIVFINDRKEISFTDTLEGKIEFTNQENYSIR